MIHTGLMFVRTTEICLLWAVLIRLSRYSTSDKTRLPRLLTAFIPVGFFKLFYYLSLKFNSYFETTSSVSDGVQVVICSQVRHLTRQLNCWTSRPKRWCILEQIQIEVTIEFWFLHFALLIISSYYVCVLRLRRKVIWLARLINLRHYHVIKYDIIAVRDSKAQKILIKWEMNILENLLLSLVTKQTTICLELQSS